MTYPERAGTELPPLDLLSCPPLTFQEPDMEAFPCLRMAMECAQAGGTACAVLNGANEAAVGMFLRKLALDRSRSWWRERCPKFR